MKKNLFVFTILCLSFVVFFGCASTPDVVETVAPDYRVVDNKAMSTGMTQAPDWYDAASNRNAALKELYPDSVSVVISGDGTDLAAVKFDLETFGANVELAGRLSTYIDKTAGNTITSDGFSSMQKASQSFTAVASKAEFSGLEKEADYWILKEFKDGSRVYTYTVLYIMPQAIYNQQLEEILNELPKEEQEVIQPIVDKAKETIGTEY